MSSTRAQVMSSSSVDLTAYRKNLTEISALSKDEITTLQSYDAEQMRLEKKIKDAKARVSDTHKKRAASCTYNKITKGGVDYRRHSVPRTSVLDRREKQSTSQWQVSSVGEPSVSGLSSSTDDETVVEKIDSDILSSRSSAQEKVTAPSISHRVLELQTSFAPMSRRRLSIPKRSYSPEPLKRTRPIFGIRKVVETIRLSDLKEKIALLKCENFCLPSSFSTCGDRKSVISGGAEYGNASLTSKSNCQPHFRSPKAHPFEIQNGGAKRDELANASEEKSQKEVDVDKTVEQEAEDVRHQEMEKEKRKGREGCGRGRKKEGEKGKANEKEKGEMAKEKEREVEAKKEEEMTVKLRVMETSGEKRLEKQCVTAQNSVLDSNVEEVVLKRKRGRPRKITNILQAEKEVKRSLVKESHVMKTTLSTTTQNVRSSTKAARKIGEAIVNDSCKEKKAEDVIKLEESNRISRNNSAASTSEASNEEQWVLALHPEKMGVTADKKNADSTSLKSSASSPLKISVKQEVESVPDSYSPNFMLASSSQYVSSELDMKDMEVIGEIVEELVTKLCNLEERSKTAFCGLVMEPLRRPQERRRVPPLRIRLPKRREVRKRIPARSRDYSPPGRNTRPRFSRVSAALHQELLSIGNHTASTRRSRRSRKLLNAHDCSANESTSMIQDSDAVSLLKDSEKDASLLLHTGECEGKLQIAICDVPSFDEIVNNNLEKARSLVDELTTYAMTDTSATEPEQFSLSNTDKKTAELVNSYSVKEFAPEIPNYKQLSEPSGTETPQECNDMAQLHIRPSRPKKSYRELYPSLFKNRRKRADKSYPSSARVSLTPVSKKHRRSLPTSEENISCNPIEADSFQSKSSKCKRHSVEIGQSAKNKSEYSQNVVDDSLMDKGESSEVSKEKEKRRRASESAVNILKNAIPLLTTAEAELEGPSVVDECLKDGVNEHHDVDSLSVVAKPEQELDQDSSVNPSFCVKGSKRWRKHTELKVNSCIQSAEEIKVDTKSEIFKPKKSKRGAQSKHVFPEEKLNNNVQIKKLTLPYFKRIAQRRKLNPLAIGLKSRSDDADQKIFYRELLLRGNELRRNDGDEELDVESYVTPVGDDEYGFENPAADIASAVDRILPRSTISDEAGEATEMTVENILENCANVAPEKMQVLKEMLSNVLAQYTADVTASSICGGASVEYSTMLLNARRLRDRVFTFSEERRANAQWAHKLLIRQLPIPMLATYINLLRYCKSVARYLVDILLKEQQDDDSIAMANRLIITFMNNKILDPQTAPIAKTLGKRHLDCICLLAVDPYFAHLEYTPKIKAHEYLFKVLFPSSFGRVEQLRACLPSSVEFSAAEVVEYLVDAVSKRLKELIKKYPSKKVVLAGWGTSCFINHEVIQSVPNVHAILDFAFPLKTVDGMRGDADDTILLTYCPTLFVVGEHATDCDTMEIQKLASKMKASSGVIIVGAANSNLQMSPLHSSIERFTQKTVHRALIDDVMDFLEKVCSKNTSNSSLKPFPVLETSNADLSVMRGSTTSNRYIPKSRRQCDSGGSFEPGKKRLCSRDSHDSDFGFRRTFADTAQDGQSLLIPGHFVQRLNGNERANLTITEQSARPLVSAVKCLADETLDNLMAPL